MCINSLMFVVVYLAYPFSIRDMDNCEKELVSSGLRGCKYFAYIYSTYEKIAKKET